MHQEDLCQVLGLPATRKYEEEGGPSLAAAIEAVRGYVRQPVRDVLRLLEWQAFNIVAGNSDGHAKNLAILYDESGPRLAPFYDMLATRQYRQIDRRLAMSVATERDPDIVAREHWEALASALGMGPRVVLASATGVAERCLAELGGWKRDFKQQHGDELILQTVPRAIAARARGLLRTLAAKT